MAFSRSSLLRMAEQQEQAGSSCFLSCCQTLCEDLCPILWFTTRLLQLYSTPEGKVRIHARHVYGVPTTRQTPVPALQELVVQMWGQNNSYLCYPGVVPAPLRAGPPRGGALGLEAERFVCVYMWYVRGHGDSLIPFSMMCQSIRQASAINKKSFIFPIFAKLRKWACCPFETDFQQRGLK